MKDINNAEDLANVFKSGKLINEQAIDDNLELLEEIFKDFKQKEVNKMIDTVTLNPTQYFILVVGCYCVGWLSYWLADTVKQYLNKKYYIKGGK